jgi:hypothetical protein
VYWKDEIAKALAILGRHEALPQQRLAACVVLAQYGITEGLEIEFEALSAQFPRAAVWRRTVHQLERTGLGRALPRVGTAGDLEEDELLLSFGATEKAVPGSDTLALVFSGVNRRLGLSFDIIQRILRPTGVSTLYLRDLERTWYLSGIVGLGTTFGDAVRGLQSTIARLGVTRVLAIGNCLGCAGALRYGLAIGVEGILGFSPRLRIPDRLRKSDPLTADISEAYATASRRPRLNLIYGEDCSEDAVDVLHMAGVDGVTPVPIAHYDGHASLALLFGRGLLTRLLRRFVRSGTIGDELLAEIERAAGG